MYAAEYVGVSDVSNQIESFPLGLKLLPISFRRCLPVRLFFLHSEFSKVERTRSASTNDRHASLNYSHFVIGLIRQLIQQNELSVNFLKNGWRFPIIPKIKRQLGNVVVFPFQNLFRIRRDNLLFNVANEEIRPLGYFSGFDGLLQSFSLQPKDKALADKRQELKDGHNGEDAGEPYEAPVIRRFFETVAAILIGFVAALIGGSQFHNQRRLIGAALILGGSLIGASGICLWWLAAYSPSVGLW